MTAPDGSAIGLYTLNAHAVDYMDLPEKYARSRPAHGSILAAFLSMIDVDQRYASQGFGGDLLVDVLMRIARISENIGIAVVILDVLDDSSPDQLKRRKALYAKYGFQSLLSDPLRMFLPVATIRELLAE